MKKCLLAFVLSFPLLFLTGCGVTTYSPAYGSDYVYTVGYYGYQPYWSRQYYSGYISGDNYWTDHNYWGRRGYNRGWHARRW